MKKTIKRLSVFLLVAAMMALSVIPALAYTAVTPSGNPDQDKSGTADAAGLTHTLTLTEENNPTLPYKVAYRFNIGEATIEEPRNVVSGEENKMITGKPSIAAITYNAGEFNQKNSSNQYYKTEALTVDWSNVSIKEPGIYSWTVSETLTMNDGTATPQSATSNLTSGKLVAYAVDNNGTLEFKYWYFINDTSGNTKGNVNDEYPATTVDLSVSKTVTGNQGSKDEYFKFTVALTIPTGAATKSYPVSGLSASATVNNSPYNSGAVQFEGVTGMADTDTAAPTTASLSAGGNTLTIWLKHGNTFKIEDLPYGTGYAITETNATDAYTVSTAIAVGGDMKTDDSATVEGSDIVQVNSSTDASNAVADTFLKSNTTVQFINDKAGTPPTGIVLQYGAPIAGILLVGGLFIVLMMTKRRKEQEAAE